MNDQEHPEVNSTEESWATASREARLSEAISGLRTALSGVAERYLPGDSLPCFCVHFLYNVHDDWCLRARAALEASLQHDHDH